MSFVLLSSVSHFFPLSVLFMSSFPFQLSYFILFCSTFLNISSPFAAFRLYYSNQILITSLYQRYQPSRRDYFHVMELAYNPFKAKKPRLNITTQHYWPSTYTTLLCQFSDSYLLFSVYQLQAVKSSNISTWGQQWQLVNEEGIMSMW